MVYSPDLMVLSYRVFVNLPGDKQGLDLDWVSVECPSKAAYGCGKHGESLIQGLSLSVRRLGCMDLGSSLSINLNSAALQSIQMEFGVTDGMMKSSRNSIPDVVANIQSAAEQVLVVYILFRLYQNHEERAYYLVYDATDASLYMIPCLPVYNHGPRLTMAPVPARPDGAQAHELTLTARAHFLVDRGDDGCRLCVCTPATRREESPSPGRGKTTGPWAVKMQRFPKKFPQNFRADLTFSLDDNVFWADLAQGVMYSSLRQSGPNADVVFVELPDGYRISLPKDNARVDLPLKMHRTMASFQGTIKFLCITGKMVKLWTLDLDLHMWIEDELLTCSWEELWTKACSKDARLSNVKPREPQYPVMMPDGELCLLLPKTRHKMGISVKRPDYICSFDMYIKTSLCLGRVRDYHLSKHFILPSGFFMDCSPAPLKRKPPTLKRKQPSVNEQGLQANTQEEATKRRVFVSCNERDYRKPPSLFVNGLVRRARGNPTPVASYGDHNVATEARVGAGRRRGHGRGRAPAPRVGGRGRRPQRRLRPVRGHDGAARRRVHLRRGLRRPRQILQRRRSALPLRQPPRARQQRRQGRGLPPPGRRDFAPHHELLLRPVIFWIHGSFRREEIRREVASSLHRQQHVHGDQLHPGPGVPEGQAPEPVLEGRRLQLVQGALRLRVRRQQLRGVDDELQGQGRAGGLQPRDPAGVLGHGQTRGRAQLVVRSVQAPAVLPVRALLQPQGLAHQPVQQLLLDMVVVLHVR